MLLIFARHGQTIFGKEDRLEGGLDSPLTALGRRQAKRMALFCRKKNISQIYSSPLVRSLTTAKIVGDLLKIRPVVKKRLREVYYGKWDGERREKLKKDPLWSKRQKDLLHFTPPSGESYQKQYTRCTPFFKKIAKSKNNVLVVVHKGVMRSAAMFFGKLTPAEFNNLNYDNDEIILVKDQLVYNYRI